MEASIFRAQNSLSNVGYYFINRRLLSRLKPPPGKPPCLPPSKIRRYVVKNPPWKAPSDVKELLWRRNAYNTALRSIRTYFAENLREEIVRGDHPELEEEQREFLERLQENEQENLRLAKIREERESESLRQMEAYLLERISEKKLDDKEVLARNSKEVFEAIERSKEFITWDNLEEKIEHCLENSVDYNYAIDITGAKYVAPTPPPSYLRGIAPPKRIYTKPEAIVPKDPSPSIAAAVASAALDEKA